MQVMTHDACVTLHRLVQIFKFCAVYKIMKTEI